MIMQNGLISITCDYCPNISEINMEGMSIRNISFIPNQATHVFGLENSKLGHSKHEETLGF